MLFLKSILARNYIEPFTIYYIKILNGTMTNELCIEKYTFFETQFDIQRIVYRKIYINLCRYVRAYLSKLYIEKQL